MKRVKVAGPAGNPTQPPEWNDAKRRWEDLSDDAKRLWLSYREGKRWDGSLSARQLLGDIIVDLALRPLPAGLTQLATSRKITIHDALTLGWSACLIALKTEYTRLVVTEPEQ